jgi:L-gulonate 3-dehydrogenase
MYYEMAQTQSKPREWDEESTRRIERQRRLLLPQDRLQARQAWRDRRLMALAAHKAQATKTITE